MHLKIFLCIFIYSYIQITSIKHKLCTRFIHLIGPMTISTLEGIKKAHDKIVVRNG